MVHNKLWIRDTIFPGRPEGIFRMSADSCRQPFSGCKLETYQRMTTLPMTRSLLAILLAATALPVAANTIYKCTDENGGTLISNTKVDKNCRPVVSGPDSSMPAPKPRASAAANPSPAGFPKVAEDTQKARDNDRRRILEQELAAEQKSLEAARKDLAEQEGVRVGDERNYQRVLDRLQPYKDRVAQHERNIQAINRELSNLR